MRSRVISLALLVFLASCAEAMAEKPTFTLADPGTEEIVDYSSYGEFVGAGTENYRYIVRDPAGLSRAVGEGIYPNSASIFKDPQYIKFKKEGKLEGSHWDFINTKDYQANFYKWATTSESRGVKLFYAALALERAGHYIHALKAYYAIVVHFPHSIGWTYWHTPWYVGQVIDEDPIVITSTSQVARNSISFHKYINICCVKYIVCTAMWISSTSSTIQCS